MCLWSILCILECPMMIIWCTCWKASSVFISTKAVPLMFPVSRCRGMFTSVDCCTVGVCCGRTLTLGTWWNSSQCILLIFAIENSWIQHDILWSTMKASRADPTAVEGPEPLRHRLRSAPAVWFRRRCRGSPSPPPSGHRCLRPDQRELPSVEILQIYRVPKGPY